MTYAIYEDFYADVEKKLNRITKKCKKYGNDFIFEIKGEEIREKFNEELKQKQYYKFILVEVEGTAKINDWECIAVLEIHTNGNIIRRINTEIELPDRFKHTENICEHCNSKRQRKNLYVIHNTKTDEWKQVGGNCLSLYTNGLSLEYVTAYMDGITELEENNGCVGGNIRPYYDVYNVLAYATEIIEKIGYFNANSNLPTKSIVGTLLSFDIDRAIYLINKDLKGFNIRLSSKDFNKPDTDKKVEKIIEYYKSLENSNEFVHNIHIMLDNGYIHGKNIGYLCYLPKGYTEYINKKAEEEVKRNTTEHFGEVGKRYKDKVIKNISCITSWETQWGITSVYKIVLEDGTILTWKTSNCLYLEENKKFDKITFTVKSHNEYKGEKQTVVTRVHWVEKGV